MRFINRENKPESVRMNKEDRQGAWRLVQTSTGPHIMGIRTALHAGMEIQALSFHQRTSREFPMGLNRGVTPELSERVGALGDSRTENETKR